MLRHYILVILLITVSPLYPYPSKDEIIVHLDVGQTLTPLYLGSFTLDEGLDQGYNKSLNDILLFDLDNCGKFKLYSRLPHKDSLLKITNIKEGLADPSWKKDKIQYVLSGHITKTNCSIMLYTVDLGHIKHLKDLPLTGNVDVDRKQMHKVCDTLLSLLFNEEGIASSQILYTLQLPNKIDSGNNPYSSQIWICDYDGCNAKLLTPAESYCITPIFYPSRKNQDRLFLYVSYDHGPSKIFISPIDNPKAEAFISLRGNQLLPAISKDRSKIAFICDASGRADLFVQAMHPQKGLLGKPIQAYTFPSSVQASPTFSPDGKKIAFVSDKDKTPRIYLIDTPHHSLGRKLPEASCLTKKNPDNTCPNWSPDGKRIAYSAKTDGVRQIWIYNFETNEEIQLTTGGCHKENPCWAPDNLHIVFNTVDTYSSDLYLIDVNRKKITKITNGPGKKHYPSWQP